MDAATSLHHLPLALRLCRATLALTAFCCAAAAAAQDNHADPARYLDDIRTLSAPDMDGRGAGTAGIAKAEQMLEQRYRALGLKPAGSASYAQPFKVITGAALKDGNRFTVKDGKDTRTLEPIEEFVPFSFSASGEASGPAVFAGYGISAPEFGYDDYAGLDAKDRVVVILRDEPRSFDEKAGNAGVTRHAQLITKLINARNHGARALVLLNGELEPGEEDLLTKFGSVHGPINAGLIFIQAKNATGDAWFRLAGKSLREVQKQINDATAPASFAFPPALNLAIRVNIEETQATVNNVLAYLPGQTDEYIIIGAHYDHLGYGNLDSLAPSQIGRVHPGADDNASGTAGVLELARLLAQRKEPPRRGILFANFAGEELGLLGSAEWVKAPTLPIGKAVAMINMDMIGRPRDLKIYVGGVGTGAGFKDLLDAEGKLSPVHLEYSSSGYAASDHTSFVTHRIPVLFFFSGLHSDYHKPSDTWDKIDAPDAAKLLDLIADVALKIDSAPERVAFLTVKDSQPQGFGARGGRGYGPWFGSIPDFGQIENGVKFSDVTPGSPAEKAGLKPGDVLVQFGDKPIHNLYDFTDALRRAKVGDVVAVQVLREGKTLTASVKLEQRK